MEQGKETLRMYKVTQVLALFGYKVRAGSETIIDPYHILLHYMNQKVRVSLKTKPYAQVLYWSS